MSRIQVHWARPPGRVWVPSKVRRQSLESPDAHCGFQEGSGQAMPQPSLAGSGGRQAPASGDKVMPSLSQPTYLPLLLRCCQAVMQRYHQGPVIGGCGGRVRAEGATRSEWWKDGRWRLAAATLSCVPCPSSSPCGGGGSIISAVACCWGLLGRELSWASGHCITGTRYPVSQSPPLKGQDPGQGGQGDV